MILDVLSNFNGSVIRGCRKHRNCFQIKSSMAMTSEHEKIHIHHGGNVATSRLGSTQGSLLRTPRINQHCPAGMSRRRQSSRGDPRAAKHILILPRILLISAHHWGFLLGFVVGFIFLIWQKTQQFHYEEGCKHVNNSNIAALSTCSEKRPPTALLCAPKCAQTSEANHADTELGL